MAEYDSDSSVSDNGDIETNVLLGYASQEPTGDDFSQLGGRPTWLDNTTAPSGALAKCKVCNGIMCLLLQLNGDLPDWFPGHERRLYILGCRRKGCRRKSGSIRALRAVRVNRVEDASPDSGTEAHVASGEKPAQSLGESLFGVKSPTPTQANPFASSSTASSSANPFSSQKATTTQPPSSPPTQTAKDLSDTFASKLRISSSTPSTTPPQASVPPEPWQEDPNPYPSYYLDADKEYLEPTSDSVPSNARLDTEDGSTTTAAEEKALFESSMDKTFQRFADTVNQNPEQVLRYEFAGQPLLYSKEDAVGKLFSASSKVVEAKVQTSHAADGSAGAARLPRCSNCGAARVFELQLTPHAITELERDETGVDGMDWGTVLVGVCSEDCTEKAKGEGVVGYLEEWVGVQWEEIVEGVRR